MSNLSEIFPNFNNNNYSNGFKIFPLIECPRCGKGAGFEATDDGNRTQKCLGCNKYLRKNGIYTLWFCTMSLFH